MSQQDLDDAIPAAKHQKSGTDSGHGASRAWKLVLSTRILSYTTESVIKSAATIFLRLDAIHRGYLSRLSAYKMAQNDEFRSAGMSLALPYVSSRFPSAVKQLLSAEQIDEGVSRLAAEISVFYAGRPLTILGVLNGSIVLVADLIRRLELPFRKVALVQASSYREASAMPALLQFDLSMLPEIGGRDVLLVDDIFDTGNTLAGLVERLRPKRGRPASARPCCCESMVGEQCRWSRTTSDLRFPTSSSSATG